MNINISNSVLDNILTNLQPFLDKKDSSQITSHIYLETKDNELIFRATDFEMGLLATTQNLNIIEQGIATVNGKQILDIIKRLKEGEVSLHTKDENLIIKQNKSSFKLPMFNAQEFPEFPSLENLSKLEVNAIELISSMKKIFPVIDTNNPKRELTGALLDIKEYSYNFVATDTKRLSIVKFDNPSGNKLALIVPKRAITEIQKLFFDQIELYYNEKELIIKSKNYIFFTHLINGKFPDYERIIPKETLVEFSVPKAKIIEGIKLINSITNDVKLTFKSHQILFESLSSDNLEASTEVEIELPIAEEIILGINSRHVMDFLNQIDTMEFTWCLNEKNAPFVLKSENFSTVIMPIIL
ncbi:DNA polymerase III subunit beta [Helicobacter valdiviensis]|uniref:Beta sliding clamp n=1 Tax=Helicobacter valdiviensis TaxID=1458358 RepID=A0A2W6MVU7_9HELI|nr:DNA polymerase III subunit beta [Helicobacter valdiviensis]PZT47348.1 DNA polymerase III subunit beta [Helicobacter valdiviensis]